MAPKPGLSPDVLLAAWWRVAVLSIVLFICWRMIRWRHWPILALAIFGLASNAFFLLGSLRYSGIFGVPYVGLIGWVCIRKMQDDPHLMRALLARKETEWSKERHDLIGELATLKARVDYYDKKQSEARE